MVVQEPRDVGRAPEPLAIEVLDALIRHAPVGFALLDDRLCYVRVNEALATLNDRPVAAHLGRNLGEVLPLAAQVEPQVRQVLSTGEPLLGVEVQTHESGRHRHWLVSCYPVPDVSGDRLFGVGLVVMDVTERRHAEDAATAAAQRLELLNRASALVAGTLDPRLLLADLAELAVPEYADHCYLELVDDGESGVVRRLLTAHAPGAEPPSGDMHQPGAVVRYPAGHPARVALEGGRAVLSLVDEALLAGASRDVAAHARRVGMTSVMSAPLRARGAVLGVITFVMSVSGRHFDEDDRAMAEELAARAAAAVANARAYEREHQARTAAEAAEGRVRLLADASAALGASLRREEVLEVAFSLLVPSLADACSVHVVDEEGRIAPPALHHRDPEREAGLFAFFEQFPMTTDIPGIGQVIASGRPQLISAIDDAVLRAATDDPELLAWLRDLGLFSSMAVPLNARGKTFGALGLIREGGRPYDEEDLTLAEELGGRVALALDNARLYAAERSVAVVLQRSLLPQTPQPGPGLDVATRYLPGAAGAEVGGDWYDVFRLPGECTGLVIGDVMGRGVRAAAVMGQLRAALRGYALEGDAPSTVLRRLNRVVDGLDELNLVTCVYGVYDPRQRTLSLSTAGHLPPLVVSPGSIPRYADIEPGLPLGVRDDQPPEQVIEIPAGSLLLLYTDGLVEAAATPIDFGMETLRRALAGPVRSPDEACDVALIALSEHGHHGDDTALLAVRTAPP